MKTQTVKVKCSCGSSFWTTQAINSLGQSFFHLTVNCPTCGVYISGIEPGVEITSPEAMRKAAAIKEDAKPKGLKRIK